MTIGIDIDDTITKTKEALEKQFGSYDMIIKKINKGIKEEYVKYFEPLFSDIAMYDNVVDVINFLKSKGYKLIAITARGAKNNYEIIPITDKFLNSHGFPFDKVIYAQEHKAEACLENNVDIFIDDNESVLDEIAACGIKTVRFSEKTITSKHMVLHSWLEIKKYIEEMGE